MKLDQTARAILEHETSLIEPARLAYLDQVAAQVRDRGDDLAEILTDALEALDRAQTGEQQTFICDLAYVAAVVVVGRDP